MKVGVTLRAQKRRAESLCLFLHSRVSRSLCVRVCVRVYMCVCVCERDRDRERESKREFARAYKRQITVSRAKIQDFVLVVCVSEREEERDRESPRARARTRETLHSNTFAPGFRIFVVCVCVCMCVCVCVCVRV